MMNDIMGPYSSVSHGRLYPLLAKLEAEGFITAFGEEHNEQARGRQLHRYQITNRGQERFHELMMNIISTTGDYQKTFLYKVQGMEFLQPSERIFLLDHYLNFCQAHIFYFTARAGEIERMAEQGTLRMNSTGRRIMLNLIRHVSNQWQLELDWAKQMREQELEQNE